MASAAVPDPKETPPPSLADRLTEARRAETAPRNRLAKLQAAFDAALREHRLDEAHQLQGQLPAAREALAIAEGTTRGLAEWKDTIDRQHASEQAALAEARRHEEAHRILNASVVAEQAAKDGVEKDLAEMRAALDAARHAYERAVAGEGSVRFAQTQGLSARATLGQYGAAVGPPRAPGWNRASALAGTEPIIRELARWRG
jgi:hypothetical protein